MSVAYEVGDRVAVLTLDSPPVNGLGYAVRRGVVDALARAQADEAVDAIVIAGAGKVFCAGADIREFGTREAMREPELNSVIAMLEDSAKPVVAAIHGVVMGGGLELALGCHWRVVAPGTKVAFPEVKLGLLPGAGGTQRLPRVLGVEPALNLIVSGEAILSEQLAALPGQKLFDLVAGSAESLLREATDFARSKASQAQADAALPRVRELPCSHPNPDAFFQFARNTVRTIAKGYPAPLKCIDAVEAATHGSFAKGLATERALFAGLVVTPESEALRHVFFAERAASRIADVGKDVKPRRVERVAVIGAGTMGGGIAMAFLNAGIPVRLVEAKQEALNRGVEKMSRSYESRVKRGKLSQEGYEQRMERLSTTLDYADIADADLVIEAVFEDMEVKKAVFRKLDAAAREGAILASNTSTLNINELAAVTGRAHDVVGMHFFSPAQVMRLLEVVRGDKTAKDVLATALAVARRIRKTAVVAGVCDGFIGNRMVEQYSRQAAFLVDEGATPAQVDAAIERFGFAMGPFRMIDMAGNDIAWAIRKRRYVEHPDMKYSKAADRLCEMGRLGQKVGKGWYDYAPGRRRPIPSAEVLEMIAQYRSDMGIVPRKIDDQEIVERLVFALVNEGARILEEGIAAKASDIDIVYLMGYGFPPYRGGPMQYADRVGAFNIVRKMARFARNPNDDAAFWQPAALLQELADQGGNFNAPRRALAPSESGSQR